MIYRLLTIGEKLYAIKRLRELDRLDHLIPPDADMISVHRKMERVKVVGAFEADELRFIYWTYGQDACAKRRYIAVGALHTLDRAMFQSMRHCAEYLTREWELWGEIDADNPRGLKLGRLCGFSVEAVLDGRIIVKHERSRSWEKAAAAETSRM